jgi:hypothetical protein
MVVPNRASESVTTPLSVYLSTSATVTNLTLDGPGGQTVPLIIGGQSDNRVDTTIPAFTLAPGSWSVQTTTLGSVEQSPQVLTITGSTTGLSIIGVSSGASNQGLVRMHVLATDPPPVGQESFAAVPEVFLQPHNSAANAIRVDDRDFVSAGDVAISLPAGIAAGTYDLVAINADGATGVVSSGLTISALPAPVIKRRVPEVSPNTTGQVVTLYGTNFGASAPTVSASCVDSAGNPTAQPQATVGPATATSVVVTFNFSALSPGSTCRLGLITAEGQIAYANQAISNTSLNLGPVATMSSGLQVGRRGLVLLAGPAAPEGHRLYAIGGDDGAISGAMNSVESAPLGANGALGMFRDETSLPQPVTFAGGITVGDYLYVIGGNNGVTQLDKAFRSRVLRDMNDPTFQVLDATPAPASGSGLGAGLWRYRIAPLSSAADLDNPSGEGLPGAELSVDVPVVPGGVQITLNFSTTLTNIDSFAIYRSPSAGASTFERLATVANTGQPTYTDIGGTTSAGTAPRALGSLGNWIPLPNMSSGREGPAIAAAPDPSNAALTYVYAIAGGSGPTTALTSYEYLQITTLPDGHQLLASTWTAGAQTLSTTAREYLGAWTADSFSTAWIPSGTTYIYAGPGASSLGTGVNSVDAGKVAAGGDLGVWDTSPQDVVGQNWGYATAQADNRLYIVGGANGTPSSTIKVATIGVAPPTFGAGAWNIDAAMLGSGVVYAGAAATDGFIYVAGGQTGLSQADTMVQRIQK